MATDNTYYIDTNLFSTATAVWSDSALTTKAPDGWYQAPTETTVTYRQQTGGVLGTAANCECPVPCGSNISGSGNVGSYIIDIDMGNTSADVGAIIVYFQPYNIPDGILATFDSTTYNTLTTNAHGIELATAGEINFVKNNTTVLAILGGNEIMINPSYALREPLKVTNSITASGAISASNHISASSFNATPSIVNQLTASYAMTASRLDPPVNYKPIVTHTSNFSSDLIYAGRYNIVGGTLAITVTTGSSPTNLEPGMEWDFFQTSSGDSFTFTQGTGVEIISRNSNKRLAAVGSAGTLKYISGQTFHLIGDLTI